MGIVETYLKTAVHTEKSELYSVTNTMDEDFKFEWRTSRTDWFEIPAHNSVTFPAEMAFHACIELAKKISYTKNSKTGMSRGNWLPIAEEIISPLKKTVASKPEKTEAEKARDLVESVNKTAEAEKARDLVESVDKTAKDEKATLISKLEEKGFRSSTKNDIEAKTFSKMSGVKTLKNLLK